MDIKFKIALITSLVSIIVALISFISSYINSRKVVDANREMELLKFKMEEKMELLKFKMEEKKELRKIFNESLRERYIAIGDHIKQIQSFKDSLVLLDNTIINAYDSDTALNLIEKCRIDLFECFIKGVEYLDTNSHSAAHKAKNECLSIQNMVITILDNKEFVNLSISEKDHIRIYREKLTEYQDILRDNRVKLLEEII